MNSERYQVVIVGAGLVGAAAALALGRQGLRVALIERQPPQLPDASWDTRIYAISPASQCFLERLGAWQRMDANRIQPVFRMEVKGDTVGAIRFDAYEAGVSHLATIAESGRLQHALWQALQADGNVALMCPATIDRIEREESRTRLMLADGAQLEAELLVGADGGASRIREWAGLGSTLTPYGQSGVVANFACERPHRGIAFEWFFDHDILAWLPLGGTSGNQLSMVWSTPTAHADELVALEAAALAEKVQAAGHSQLGGLRLLTPAVAFPLRLNRVAAVVAPGVALIGDAAHGVHPLAGQGVNLGFGDAEALVEVLTAHRKSHCGDVRVLQRYARARAEPVQRMQALTHGLHHLFASEHAGWLRNTGMTWLNRLPPLKAALVREAMS
ncbi:MAG TPA: UbiH/UbiF family hydroxylase [Thiobacillus sp.]|nr:MAG: 2-octaprenyl-3-methyl-6-methoxy-1,4-benzoquinol hydroxylase [Hydrogenophilales bacterium 28-61-11]OYZ58354.1 MAG: 2-octaprenyl-3-methyl-6-methoxy-1,4-benzoquinol hydroxylase [Hydrogenophilales bacterium 16-61-112]OZA47405.1 MAG: 2-octaprenyl-3-methyl-6-methoxy-1,4-benzoquinol hydroxylase [Hydrogenophilales bacterium 17-61-76]HQT30575.1 UbiH/UbiF family hydroxylase [Thiobacillus sp.]HQT69949.1 UbiH/UbiF family hydroxylase [Thiobacillus sp.]